MAIQGRGQGETRDPPPPLSKGLDDRAPNLSLGLDPAQPRSQSSSAISDVTSPVKLVGKIRFQASSGHSDSANRPGYEAGSGTDLFETNL